MIKQYGRDAPVTCLWCQVKGTKAVLCYSILDLLLSVMATATGPHQPAVCSPARGSVAALLAQVPKRVHSAAPAQPVALPAHKAHHLRLPPLRLLRGPQGSRASPLRLLGRTSGGAIAAGSYMGCFR